MELNIRLHLLGKIKIELNGTPVEFKRRKSVLLVAYLALHEGSHSREKIADLFWGNSSEEDSRRTLRVVLTDIRKTLGHDILISDRDTLSFNSHYLTHVDAHQFLTLLHDPLTAATPKLLSALELYQGNLLADLYEDWLPPLQELYRSKQIAALLTLTSRTRAEGQYSLAAEFAERILLLDPFHETALQHLIVSLAANGEKEQALAHFQRFEQQNQKDVSQETLKLIKQIQSKTEPAFARLTNLPRPLTSFVGREDELNQVETLLTQHNLITLLGAGGSGKTRLAIQAADETMHNYQDGTWWVDLSPLTQADLVPQSIAKSLGIREQLGKTYTQALLEFISNKKMLLLIDNCEQSLNICAQTIATLLANCPQLTVLATSREPLNVEGEIGWPVPALPLPQAGGSLKQLARNESVQLFFERGRSANPSFELTETTLEHIVRICRRLDGIPLALELAATLLRSMPVKDVASRIDRQFETLHLHDDMRPPRQQTLHALIDWSYKLLTPAEQLFFRRLGVFAGGWSFESAMAVAGGFGGENLYPEQNSSDDRLQPLPISFTDIVYGLLDALKRRSLISISHTEGRTRYRMLETLREFALERCLEHHELNKLKARHLKEMLRLAIQTENELSSGTADQATVLKYFDPEVDNVRLAFGWALHDGNIEDGLMLASQVYRYWSVRQMVSEINEWLERFCSHPRAQQPTLERAYALTSYALSLRNDPQRRFNTAITHEAATIFETLRDKEGLAHAQFAEGETLLNYGEIDAAETSLLKSITYFRASPQNIQTLASNLTSLSRIQMHRQNFEKAYEYVHESLSVSERSQAAMATGWNLLLLGDIAFHLDKLTLAAQHYERSISFYLPVNRLGNIAYLQEALAAVAFAQGDLPAAQKWIEASLTSYDQYNGHSTFSRAYRAAIAQAQGDLQTAHHWLELAVQDLKSVEVEYRSIYLTCLANYTQATENFTTAATLYALALRLKHTPGMILFPAEIRAAQKGLEAMQKKLPPDEYQAAVAEAGSITFEAAVQRVFPI